MSQFSPLTSLPPDALLGLMTAYREDTRAEKFDLGVGVYKDDAGNTPVMSAVAKAEALMLQRQTTKVYEGPRGNVDFCAAIEDFVFGADAPVRKEGAHAVLYRAGRLRRALAGRWPDAPPRREEGLGV
jgi:aspartate/tyrosine/aromatic aminotransferase